MCNTQQTSFYSTSFWLIWDKEQPKRKAMLLRMAQNFYVIFRSEESRPLSLFPPLSEIKDDRCESTNWVCVLLGRIIIKRSAHSRLSLLLLPSDWSGMRSFQERAFPSPRAPAKPTTCPEKVWGRWPRPDQSSARANRFSLVPRPWAPTGE